RRRVARGAARVRHTRRRSTGRRPCGRAEASAHRVRCSAIPYLYPSTPEARPIRIGAFLRVRSGETPMVDSGRRGHSGSMNDSTSPPQNGQGAQGTDGTGSSGQAQSGPVHGGPHAQTPPPSNGFFQWIRGLGLVRDGSDRWFAGVASGLAHKARIDPRVARGVFAVLALIGGPGLLLYLFAWLFLPDHTGKIHMEDLFR